MAGVRETLNRSRFVRFYSRLPDSLYRQSTSELRSRFLPVYGDVSPQAAAAAAQADEEGYAIVENFWPADKCRSVAKALSEHVNVDDDCTLDCGATVRINFKVRPDGSTRRIYGVDKIMPELAGLRFDPLVLGVPAARDRIPYKSRQLAFEQNVVAYREPQPWHFDTFYPEWKAMLYLEDVDASNGATAYIPGSHRDHGFRRHHQLLGYFQGLEARFFSDDDLGARADEQILLDAPAGTLVLMDGRGLHRVMPQIDRPRRLLVNYLVRG